MDTRLLWPGLDISTLFEEDPFSCLPEDDNVEMPDKVPFDDNTDLPEA